MAEVKSHKVKQLSSRLDPNAIYWVQASANLPIEGFITDIQGVPYPLKDLQGSGGITGLTNTDGNLVITGADNKVINLAPALLSLVNSALQSGANISELVNDEGFITVADIPTNVSEFTNDAGYLTSFIETDPIFQASEASLFVTGDKANLDNQSGINSGDETTSSIQIKRPLKTVNNESLEGIGNIQIDYNDLDNLPTIPTVITNHSGLSLDDGTNPHGTTKGDVGLGSVPNIDTSTTSNISEGSNKYFTTARVLATILSGLSLATGGVIVSTDSILVAFGKIQKQIDDLTTSIGNKLDKVTTSGVERVYIINADGSQGTKATSEFGGGEIYIENISVSGGYTVDFDIATHRLTLTGNTTFSEINLPSLGFSKTITLHINGNFGIVLPASWTQYISGAYNGTAPLNTIVIETIGTERKVQISQPD